MTDPERKRRILSRYIYSMRMLAAIYLGLAVAVLFFNGQLVYLVNFIPQVFNIFEVSPNTEGGLWVAFTFGMFLTLAAVSIFSSLKPNNTTLLWIHFFSKIATVLGFAFLFFYQEKIFGYVLFAGLELFFAGYLLWCSARLALTRTGSMMETTSPPVPTDDSSPNAIEDDPTEGEPTLTNPTITLTDEVTKEQEETP